MNKFVQCISQDKIDYAAVTNTIKAQCDWQVYLLHGTKYMVLIDGSGAGTQFHMFPEKEGMWSVIWSTCSIVSANEV